MSAGKAKHLEGPFKKTLWRSTIIYKVQHPSQYRIWWNFSTFTGFCRHRHNLNLEHVYHSEQSPCTHFQSILMSIARTKLLPFCILPLCNSLFWGYFIKGATKCIWFLSPTLVLQVFLFPVVIYPLWVLMHFPIVSYPILVLTAHTPNLAVCS